MTAKYTLSKEVLQTNELEEGKRYFFIGIGADSQIPKGVSNEYIAVKSWLVLRTDSATVYGTQSNHGNSVTAVLVNAGRWVEVIEERETTGETYKITYFTWRPLDQEFAATLKVYDADGNDIGRFEMASRSLERLIEMMKPLNPENL